MFDETSIAQKEAQGPFTKTSSPLVASFKVGASLFLIFLFDFFEFICFYIVAPFMLFYLEKRASNNGWSACCPSRPPIIHSVPPNVVLHHLMRVFPSELQSWYQFSAFAEVPICQCHVHLSHHQVPCKVSIRPELGCPCPLNWNRSMSSIVAVVYLVAVSEVQTKWLAILE